MTAVHKSLGALMVLLSCAMAQDRPAAITTVQNLAVTQEGQSLRLAVDLSSPVEPKLQYATHPDRLVLDLPGATCEEKPKTLEVNSNGVRRIRMARHSTNPPVVRVVVELDQRREHALSSNGGRIILTVLPGTQVAARNSQGALSAASSGGLAGIFHRQKDVPLLNGSASGPAGAASTPVTGNGLSTSATASDSPPEQQVATAPQSRPTANVLPGSAGQPSPGAQAAPANSTALNNDSAAQSMTGADVPSKLAAAQSDGPTLIARPSDPSLRTVFKVKYVAEGVAYLDGGRSAGLTEGTKLEVEDSNLPAQQGMAVDPADPRIVAELEVSALAETSAVTEIHAPKRPVKVGDLAYLSSADAEALIQQRALSATRKYPAVISFTQGDPLDEEVHDAVPRPPSPAVNRARGRIGFDYMSTISHGSSGMTSSDFGMIFRGDLTRMNGTYWNLSGYWRGRLTSQSPAGQQTLQDLINRTYHLSMTYDNPNSAWVAGFGRLYLPWATSLDTIDGGYFGRKISPTATLGVFGGSTPDPTSWNYSPDRAVAGSFINLEGGDFSKWHYSSTSGAGISMIKWQLDKPFGFLDNMVSYTQHFSVYDALQVDSPAGNPAVPAPGLGLSRNFLTVRVQPHPRLELDFNHTYFRDIPTFDPALIGTGLLDKYLFQGVSVGARVQVRKQIFVYTQLGRSNRTGDAKNSLNQLYGITYQRLPWFGLRADVHYAQFSSSFGSGSYKAFSLARTFTDSLRLEVLAGDQRFTSTMTNNTDSRFVTGNVETNFGPHYFIQGGYTFNRGQLSYDQWMFTLGYRFDSRGKRRE